MTTFVTTGQKARRKTPWIDDVCNNTHPSTPKTQRTRRDSMATLKPTTPLRATNKGPLKPTSPLHPKTAPKTPISHPQRRWRFHSHTGISEQRRWRFQTTGPAGLQGLTAAPPGSNDTTATQISHVIYRAHFSRHPKNVAIPTIQIQCLNKPQGNYVRN